MAPTTVEFLNGMYSPTHCCYAAVVKLVFYAARANLPDSGFGADILNHAYPPLVPGTVLPALLRLGLALAFALQVLFFLLALCIALRLSLTPAGF